MRGNIWGRAFAAVAFVWTATLALCGAAVATTFCVPNFHAACPNSGGNVAQASLEAAMQMNGDDGTPDLILLDTGTISTQNNSYELDSGDNDDLEIVGAGPDKTTITNTGSGNEFMMNLNGARDVTMRDLTLEVPAAYPDNQGGALQAEEDTFSNVDIRSLNVRGDGSTRRSAAASSPTGASTARGAARSTSPSAPMAPGAEKCGSNGP